MDLVMGPHGRQQVAAGRAYARRLVCLVALLMIGGGAVLAGPPAAPQLTVAERDGAYHVAAGFAVQEPLHAVMSVLTDYARIPKFMPDVKLSKVLERNGGSLLVEQEAVSRFMLFSKRVHLILDVQEEAGSIRFRDRCGNSFVSYEGAWLVSEHDSLTVVDYHLTAKPAFDVPAFVLKRLLKRDALVMIERLQTEIAARAAGQ